MMIPGEIIPVMFLIAFVRGAEIAAEECSIGWRKLGDTCFYFSSGSELFAHRDAEEYCRNQGGQLASISSENEWPFLLTIMQIIASDETQEGSDDDDVSERSDEITDPTNLEFWVGLWKNQTHLDVALSINERRMGWIWMNGASYPGGSNHWMMRLWDSEVPGDEEPTGDASCVRIKVTGKLADLRCEVKRRFICKKALGSATKLFIALTTPTSAVTPIVTMKMEALPADGGNSDGRNFVIYIVPAVVGLVALGVGVVVHVVIKRRKKNQSQDELENVKKVYTVDAYANSKHSSHPPVNASYDEIGEGVAQNVLASSGDSRRTYSEIADRPEGVRRFTGHVYEEAVPAHGGAGSKLSHNNAPPPVLPPRTRAALVHQPLYAIPKKKVKAGYHDDPEDVTIVDNTVYNYDHN